MDCDPKSWEYGSEQDGALEIRSTYRSGEEGDEPIERARNPIVMVNPEILWRSEQRSFFDEGCLSLPGQFGTVERPAKVRVKYLDYDGNQQEMEAEGLVSHCVQHELATHRMDGRALDHHGGLLSYWQSSLWVITLEIVDWIGPCL